jgi:hypothetical protein
MAIEVQISAIRADYEELADAAEDIGSILSSSASNQLDVTLWFEGWLIDLLERIELALVDHDAVLSGSRPSLPQRAAGPGGSA